MKKLFFVLLTALILSGCATVINGSKTKVDFISEPSGAVVIVDGNQIGQTPLYDYKIKNRTKEVSFKLEGYDLLSYKVPSKTNIIYLGNLTFSFVGIFLSSPALACVGVVGILTDLASGATRKITQTEYNAIMKLSQPQPQPQQ